MAKAGRMAATAALVVVLAAGAYVTADAYDLVPGLVTLAPQPSPAAPFPTAPGAALPTADAVPALQELDPQAPVPDDARVQALVDALVADKRMGSSVGALVADQLTGDTIAAHLPTQGRTPASTAKLVMAVASMTALGADTTLPTQVVRGAGDSIVLVGGGDMMLAAGKGSSSAVDGHAGLADLAKQVAKKLRLQGVTTVRLGLDDSLFTGPAVNPGWHADYLTGGFAAPVSAVAVDIAKTREGEYVPRWPDPSMQAAKTFAARLAEAGITVTGTPTRTSAPDGAALLGEVRSAPLGQVLQYTLEASDNTIAEVLARLVAVHEGLPATFEGGAKADLLVLQGLGVDTTGAVLADASGLADGSVLPPDLLAGLLRLVTDPDQPALRPIAVGMPIGGLTGTLDDRFTQSPARGLVRAKTGSLSHVTSLAGTVQSADGRQLVFVVMADKTPDGGQDAPRRAIDAFVTSLAGCGCR